MKNKDIKDMLAQYDMGLTSANEIIELFLSINDETTPSNKVNAISAAVNQERDRLLAPLGNKCAMLLQMIVDNEVYTE